MLGPGAIVTIGVHAAAADMVEEQRFAMTNTHAVYDDGVLRITGTTNPPGLAITGEIDESGYAALLNALRAVADGQAEVHLSLGGVRYCDLAGLRAIVCVTGASGCEEGGNGYCAGARAVVLHEVPAQLITVLRIVGWDATPGLILDPPEAGGPSASVADIRGRVVG
jgi:ABC-type transporter Mla MlaB component